MLDCSQKRTAIIAISIATLGFAGMLVHGFSDSVIRPEHQQQVTVYHGENALLALLAYMEAAIDAHEKLLIVLSTVAIAVFTFTLYRATSGLWDAAEQQKSDMQESLRIAKQNAAATALQTRAFVADRIPVVVWGGQKLSWDPGDGRPIIDPVPPGLPPVGSRPVFCFENTGPTRIVVLYYAIKWQVSQDLDGEPHFGSMQTANLLLMPQQAHWITTSDAVQISDDERRSLQSVEKRLWVYAFIVYRDFLDEMHQMGTCAKWDIDRGFVGVVRENYSYDKHEKSYTRAYPEGVDRPI